MRELSSLFAGIVLLFPLWGSAQVADTGAEGQEELVEVDPSLSFPGQVEQVVVDVVVVSTTAEFDTSELDRSSVTSLTRGLGGGLMLG